MLITNVENLVRNPVEADKAHADTRETYGFVSSQVVLKAFADAGWTPVSQQAVVPRKEDRHGFQKHLVRLEHPDYPDMPGLTGNAHSRPQLIMLNSHDKASALRLTWGMIRFVCLNGLIAGDAMTEVRLRHSAYVAQRLPTAIDQALSAFPKLIEQTQTLANKQLSQSAAQKLIKTMYDARLDGVNGLQHVDYRLPLLRTEDIGSDAFTVFNRVQERVLRGGIAYTYDRKHTDRFGITTTYSSTGHTRKVTGIDETMRLNQLAYNTALELV